MSAKIAIDATMHPSSSPSSSPSPNPSKPLVTNPASVPRKVKKIIKKKPANKSSGGVLFTPPTHTTTESTLSPTPKPSFHHPMPKYTPPLQNYDKEEVGINKDGYYNQQPKSMMVQQNFISRGIYDDAACERYKQTINKFSFGVNHPQSADHRQEINQMIKAFQERTKEPPFLIMPESSYMGRWDLVTLSALVFTMFVTPYEVALLPSGALDDSDTWDTLFYVNQFVNLIFVKDMCMQFFLAYRIPRGGGSGMLVRNFRAIRKNYMHGWFTIDIVSVIPFDFIGGFFLEGDQAGSLKIIRVVRLLRLLKLARIFKASRIFKRLEARINIPFSIIGLLKFAFLLLIVGHWMACLWCMVGGGQEGGRGEEGWIAGLHGNYVYDNYDDNGDIIKWLAAWDIYSAAFYWAIVTITSVGYGDITPTNVFEMQWCTFCLLWGSCVWAYIIGNACGIVSNLDIATIEHQQTMDQLNSFMSEQNFGKPLKTKVRAFFNQTRDVAKGEMYKSLINRMSPILKEEVTEKNCEWIHDIYYLRSACPQFSVSLLEVMVAGVFVPQESVNVNNTLCAVSRGVASRGGVVKTAGTFWGEDFILSCWDLQDHVENRALTYLELLMITKEKFFEVLEDFDEEKKLVQGARIRMARNRGILKFSKAMIEQGLHGSEEIQKAMLRNSPLPTLRDRRLSVSQFHQFDHQNGHGHGGVNQNFDFDILNKRFDVFEKTLKKVMVYLEDADKVHSPNKKRTDSRALLSH